MYCNKIIKCKILVCFNLDLIDKKCLKLNIFFNYMYLIFFVCFIMNKNNMLIFMFFLFLK